jgi:hypothetical protein
MECWLLTEMPWPCRSEIADSDGSMSLRAEDVLSLRDVAAGRHPAAKVKIKYT